MSNLREINELSHRFFWTVSIVDLIMSVFFSCSKSDAIEINSDINRIDPMTTDRGVECFFQVIPIGIMGLVLTVNGSRPSSALVSIKIA